MKIILEYEKANYWEEGPQTIYKVIEVEGLTRRERRKVKKRKKVIDILTEVKSTLFDNGDTVRSEDTKIKFY